MNNFNLATTIAAARASVIINLLVPEYKVKWCGHTGDKGVSIEYDNFEIEVDHDGQIGLMIKKLNGDNQFFHVEFDQMENLVSLLKVC